MNTKRCMITTVLAAALLVSMDGTASAGNSIDVTPLDRNIAVGESGTYTVTVTTSQYSTLGVSHTISFDTTLDTTHLRATLNGTSRDTANVNIDLASTGSATWAATSEGPHTFTYVVWPQSDITCNTPYAMEISDSYEGGSRPAVTVPSVNPVPESPTFALVSIGLVGMVALGRRKKR